MRIALVAPLVAPIRSPQLGGAQVLLADLARGLVDRGHAVTLLAAEGSRVDGVPLQTFPVDTAVTPTDFATGAVAADSAFFAGGEAFLRVFAWLDAHATEFDLVHAHAYDWPAFAFGELCRLPIVHTVHLPAVVPSVTSLLAAIWQGQRRSRYVTVSAGCAATYPAPVAFDAVILNGIRVDETPFGPTGDGSLLFAGRVTPEKGLADAIAVARRLGRTLHVAGDRYDERYAATVLDPHRGEPWLRYHGPLHRAELLALMARASALLLPAQWDEPFGLVAAEAMAAGCPVVAYARGGLPEVVRHGETGCLAPPGDLEALVTATRAAFDLDRAACRRHAETAFDWRRMVWEYEQFYQHVGW